MTNKKTFDEEEIDVLTEEEEEMLTAPHEAGDMGDDEEGSIDDEIGRILEKVTPHFDTGSATPQTPELLLRYAQVLALIKIGAALEIIAERQR